MSLLSNDPIEAERLADAMHSRRLLTAPRIMATVLSALFFSVALSWQIGLAWLVGLQCIKLVDWLVFTNARITSASKSPAGRRSMLALLGVHNFWLSSLGAAGLIYDYRLGLGVGMAHVVLALMMSVIGSRTSYTAFFASFVPHAACLVLLFPLILIGVHHESLITTLAIGANSVLITVLAIGYWRRHRGLLLSETDARQRAQSASAAKSTFIATVSHELRTPIGAIQAGALEIQRTAPDGALRRNAALIVDAGRMMRTLLDDLLDMSKVEAGRMNVEAIAFEARSLVADTLRFWEAEARKRGLLFKVSGAKFLPKWVTGDPTRLRQVLNNLLSNALKFTETGQVSLHLQRTGDLLFFRVEDTGPGLSAEQMERLFSPFMQADDSVTRTHGGTGLGLALSRDLALLMGGDLTVSSALGQGATFTLALPLKPAVAPAAAPAYDIAAAPDLSALRVLAVDDHEINRRAIAIFLDPLGVELAFAENGLEALAALDQQDFDLLLLDVHMPGIDGPEVARRLRASSGRNRSIPIIAVTGATEDRDKARCLQAGMTKCVAKPIEPAELHAALAEVLGAGPVPVEAVPTPRIAAAGR